MAKDAKVQLAKLRQALARAKATNETLEGQIHDLGLIADEANRVALQLGDDKALILAERQVQDMQRENERLRKEIARLRGLTVAGL